MTGRTELARLVAAGVNPQSARVLAAALAPGGLPRNRVGRAGRNVIDRTRRTEEAVARTRYRGRQP